MRYTDARLVEHLASTYVLGTLAGGARRRFARLLQGRADLQLAVAEWEARLGALGQTVPPRPAPPRVWATIDARTRPLSVAAAAARPGPLGWLKPAGFSLGGLAAGLLAASVLFVALPGLFITADRAAMLTGQRLPQSYVGLLTDAQGNGKLLVSSLRHGTAMTVKVIGPITPPAQGRLVLWAVPAQGPAFVLGPVPLTGSATSQLPGTSEQLLAKVQKLVITAETDAAPTAPGAVVYSGNCAKLW
ncbi:MAG: anti-sigma factor [Ramlibacter sp.]